MFPLIILFYRLAKQYRSTLNGRIWLATPPDSVLLPSMLATRRRLAAAAKRRTCKPDHAGQQKENAGRHQKHIVHCQHIRLTAQYKLQQTIATQCRKSGMMQILQRLLGNRVIQVDCFSQSTVMKRFASIPQRNTQSRAETATHHTQKIGQPRCTGQSGRWQS